MCFVIYLNFIGYFVFLFLSEKHKHTHISGSSMGFKRKESWGGGVDVINM